MLKTKRRGQKGLHCVVAEAGDLLNMLLFSGLRSSQSGKGQKVKKKSWNLFKT